jgi:hypothetical protein
MDSKIRLFQVPSGTHRELSTIWSKSDSDPPVSKYIVDLSSLHLNHLTSRHPAFVLESVLTSIECQALINLAESSGFSKALVNLDGTDILNQELRSGSRLIWDDEKFTSKLWERINTFFPSKLKGAKQAGLNERLRFLRYHPGERFAPHSDGTYARENNPLEVSLMTIQLYLNEGFEGGETAFLAEDEPDNDTTLIPPPKKVEVVPKTGMILAFDQDLLHEGSLL